jgi:hypothetical protein
VDDARAGRHHAQVAERGLCPAQQLVALPVPLVLAADVERERPGRPEHVHLHRVIDHEVRRHERIDPRWIAAEVGHRVAHRGQVDDGRHPGEVLEQDARRHERHFRIGRGPRPP